jgi:hypothetical protein
MSKTAKHTSMKGIPDVGFLGRLRKEEQTIHQLTAINQLRARELAYTRSQISRWVEKVGRPALLVSAFGAGSLLVAGGKHAASLPRRGRSWLRVANGLLLSLQFLRRLDRTAS